MVDTRIDPVYCQYELKVHVHYNTFGEKIIYFNTQKMLHTYLLDAFYFARGIQIHTVHLF